MSEPTLRVHRFHPERLDPVTVYVEEIRPGASRITVQCYAQAWTAYWGSHGQESVERFVCDSHAEYVADNLQWGTNGLMNKAKTKLQREYLLRIVRAMQAHFATLKEGPTCKS